MPGRFILSVLVLGSLLIGGCGEYITFAKDSRKKGLGYMESQQFDEARGAFRDAVRQNPRDYQSYYYLGAIYDREKSYVTAIAHYKTSLNVQNASFEGREDLDFKLKTIAALAKCLAVSDQRDGEINRLEKEAAESKSGDQYLVLAKAFAERGDADSAIDAFAKAASKAPKEFYVAKDQGMYLEQVGHKSLALEALRRAYRINQTDDGVNNALRRLGIVPGPSLMNEDEMAQPLIPRGPIPNWLEKDRPKDPAVPGQTPRNPAD